jgi:hypothetical protein
MNNEIQELNNWKKHLSTTERIKIDKRNHDLRLYMIESLPYTVLKEAIQGICRELDISDISEIPFSLQKLKKAVRMIPRMEEILAGVSSFIFDRDQVLHKDILRNNDIVKDNNSLDSLLPILRR